MNREKVRQLIPVLTADFKNFQDFVDSVPQFFIAFQSAGGQRSNTDRQTDLVHFMG